MVAPELASVTRNVAAGGMVRHADVAVTIPRSSDQAPPGVVGGLLGNARIRTGAHGPGEQVAFVTSSVTRVDGSTDDEQAMALIRRTGIPQPRRRRKVAIMSPWKS